MSVLVISLEACRDGANLREALLDCGLVIVSGVFTQCSPERDALDEAVATSLSFFHLSTEDKLCYVSKDRARRGYCATSTENFASLIGQKNVNDAVEKFRIGPQLTEDDVEYLSTKASRIHFNPDVAEAPHYRSLRKYYEAVIRVVPVLVQAVDEAFGLSGKVQNSVDTRHTSILAANFYPAAPAPAPDPASAPAPAAAAAAGEMVVAISPHTDVSLFTLIAATGPGLQVQSASTGRWLDVPHIEDSLIFNLGDCLCDLSQARLNGAHSALHRALAWPCPNPNPNPHRALASACEGESVPRLSLALFVTPRHDAVLGWPGLPTDACTYDDWRKQKVKRCMQIAKGAIPT
jgi:isopenicillin N synthase-like dioxygenase